MPRHSKRSHRKKSVRGGNIIESGEDLFNELKKMLGGSQVRSPLQYPIPLYLLGNTGSMRQGLDLSLGT
jgi:hypothetical protein